MIGKLIVVALLASGRALPRNQHVPGKGVLDDEDQYQEDRRAVPDERCPEDQSHFLLPHDYDCTKFFYCEYGLRWEEPRDCPRGTEFSAVQQVCIHPTLANCTLPGSPPPPTEATTTTTTTTPRPTTTTTTTTPRPTTTTTSTTTTTTTTPRPTTTTTTTTTTPRPTTTTTSTTTTPRPTTTTTSTTTTTTPAPTTTTQAPTTAPPPTCPDMEPLPNGCPADFTVYQLLPHETNCSKFYYCVRGELAERECPPGTHFNAQLQVCDWPANAGCESSDGSECNCGDGGAGGGEGGGGDGGNGGGDGGEIGGGGGGESGGGDGGEGDVEDIELLPNGCPADFDVHKLLPHECNCSLFFYCVRGEKVERACPDGLHFNPQLQVCDWPESAGCQSGDGGDGSGPPAGNENICETGCNVLPWAHETDCDKYWRCDGRSPSLVVCSEGLHFNANTYTCDFICYANCQRNKIQATSLESGLKLFIPWNKMTNNWIGRYLTRI